MSTLGPWPKGMNNRAADHAIPRSTRQDPGDAARNAVNVDFDNAGKGRRRKGFTKVYAGLDTKGGYSCPLGKFFVEFGSLKKFTGTNTAEIVYPGITGTTFTYDYFNGVMYFSDGVLCLKITAGGVRKWGMGIPAAPMVSSTTGTYGAGTYLACCCWVDGDGVESGPSPIVSITAGDNAGIIFGNLPMTDDAQVEALRLYLSTANGKELYHVADVTLGTTSYTVAAGRYDEGNLLDNHFISPPPAGRIIRITDGRAYVADALGNVFYSEPFQYDHFGPDNYLQFPAPVDIMEPVKGGIYFAHGNQTDFYAGEPEDGSDISTVLPYGGIYGTGRKMTNSDNVCWQSQRGMVIAGPAGQIKNVQEDNVATESAVSGATLIKEKDGLRQFIAALHQPTTSALAATSWITAEKVRRGE